MCWTICVINVCVFVWSLSGSISEFGHNKFSEQECCPPRNNLLGGEKQIRPLVGGKWEDSYSGNVVGFPRVSMQRVHRPVCTRRKSDQVNSVTFLVEIFIEIRSKDYVTPNDLFNKLTERVSYSEDHNLLDKDSFYNFVSVNHTADFKLSICKWSENFQL